MTPKIERPGRPPAAAERVLSIRVNDPVFTPVAAGAQERGSRRRLATLDAPIDVARLWTGRSRRTAICVRLATRGDGRNVATIAAQFVGHDGCMVAGPLIALDIHRLPELAAALTRAHRLAVERRLIIDRRGGER